MFRPCCLENLSDYTLRVVPLHKKVPHVMYSHLSSLDNLIMAYTQGRNM